MWKKSSLHINSFCQILHLSKINWWILVFLFFDVVHTLSPQIPFPIKFFYQKISGFSFHLINCPKIDIHCIDGMRDSQLKKSVHYNKATQINCLASWDFPHLFWAALQNYCFSSVPKYLEPLSENRFIFPTFLNIWSFYQRTDLFFLTENIIHVFSKCYQF